MGISYYCADYLATLLLENGISGSALTFGRQDVAMDANALVEILTKHGVIKIENDTAHFYKPEMQDKILSVLSQTNWIASRDQKARGASIGDYSLFRGLGFDIVESLDASAHEGATHIHDLNKTGILDATGRKYNFLLDGGTTEHVFHQPNVFRNIFDVLEIGGYVLHVTPSNNYVDHGFYQFSPTLYFDWYSSNKWKIIKKHFIKHTIRADVEPWIFYDLEPDSLEPFSFGRLDGAMYVTMFCAQKTEESTYDVIPQQNIYLKLWKSVANRKQGGGAATGEPVQISAALAPS
jgi:hypothetical protein